MDTHEIMSVETLRRRMRELKAATAHLRADVPVDNPHARILRLGDVARYIGYKVDTVLKRTTYDPPINMERGFQLALSRFWFAWDAGALVKVRIGGEWRILNPHACDAALAKVAAAAGEAPHARVLSCRIDLKTLGLTVK